MSGLSGPISLLPIGSVQSGCRDVSEAMDYQAESRIVLRSELLEALQGIEYFSHLWVIYHQHQSARWRQTHGWSQEPTRVHPPGDDRCGQGIFSSRAPVRPAALGSCIVELVRREAAVLVVRGLDAIDGTPVLDVKVYVPRFDAFPEAMVPLHWTRVLEQENDLARGARCFHWDTSQVEFALGFRAAMVGLERLQARRGQELSACVCGSLFFAQGFEAVSGCSPLRGTLCWSERKLAQGPWQVRLQQGPRWIELNLAQLSWPDAAAVMKAPEAALYSAFSLIELLVVLAVVGLLSALLLPALVKVRERAAEMKCASNLHQWSLAFSLYEPDNNGCLPHTDDEGRNSPPFTCDSNHPEHECCYVDVLPPAYLQQPAWRDYTNGQKPTEGLWQCPSARPLSDSAYNASFKPSVQGYHSYAMNSYLEHDFLFGLPYGDSLQPSFLKTVKCAAPSQTLLLFEQTLTPSQGYGLAGGLDTAGFYTAEDPRALGERHRHQGISLGSEVLYLDGHTGWRNDLWNRALTNPRIPKRGDLTWYPYYY